MNKYFMKETKNGWAIFYTNYFGKNQYVADQLSKKQASKWCNRLNYAYKEGVASQY